MSRKPAPQSFTHVHEVVDYLNNVPVAKNGGHFIIPDKVVVKVARECNMLLQEQAVISVQVVQKIARKHLASG